ncbi:MAG: hypothetical protein GY832_18010 [Chloroflexi bacterium]|nr:hypothetical protein [Chloroflexota bacterium]
MTEHTINKEKPAEDNSNFGQVKAETTKLFGLVGRAVSVTFQELTNRLLIQLDHETRRHLDMLVESGAAQDRQEAVIFLISEGVKVNHQLFERVENANAQITSLQTQLRALNPEKETA